MYDQQITHKAYRFPIKAIKLQQHLHDTERPGDSKPNHQSRY